jgi:hypothetical protein
VVSQLQLLPEVFEQLYQEPPLCTCAFTVLAALSSVQVTAARFAGVAAMFRVAR